MNASICLHCPTVTQTLTIGRAIGHMVRAGDVIALHGELGAGKTQFVRGLAQGMGLDPRQVSSPTYVISHEYLPPPEGLHPEGLPPDGPSPTPEDKTWKTGVAGRLCLVHVDAYRLNGPDELRSIGFGDTEDDLLEGAVLAVEWAERVSEALGDELLQVHLEHVAEGRLITLVPGGAWGPRLDTLNLKEWMTDD